MIMEKLKMQTADAAEESIRRIAGLFPGCVTETRDADGTLRHKIDFDKLRAELGEEQILPEGSERYEFTWPGKRQAAAFAYRPIRAALRPCREESVDFDNTHNLYIEGDNLDVLKLLRETYLGKVKMIYIDPPYNTGNDFVYKDDFRQTTDDYLATSGRFDDQGQRLETNTETNGRYHTDWLNMIYPRLKVARELLSEDGAIFISIDDHEVENLKKVCNEVFGEGNFVAIINWRRSGGRMDSKYYAVVHEYILCYAKCLDLFEAGAEIKEGEVYPRYDEGRKEYYKTQLLRKWGANSLRENRPNLFYPIKGPDGSEVYPMIYEATDVAPLNFIEIQGCWRWGASTMAQAVKEGRIEFQKNKLGKWVAYERIYAPKEGEEKTKRYTTWIDDVGSGAAVIKDLFGKNVFDYSKSPDLISRFLKMAKVEEEDIILDFFSGSATTVHAVMQLNAEDGGNRRFIMVQVPEACAETSEAYKAGYATICEIGKERIRRAGAKIRAELAAKRAKEGLFAQQDAPALDTGFRVLKLASTNMEDVYYQPRDVQQKDLFEQLMNVKGDRTPLDLLFQVMLELGITLDADIREEEIAGRQVYRVNDTQLVACFEEDCPEAVVEAISRLKPLYAVVREPKDDATMTNFDEFFKTNSPDTHRRVL